MDHHLQNQLFIFISGWKFDERAVMYIQCICFTCSGLWHQIEKVFVKLCGFVLEKLLKNYNHVISRIWYINIPTWLQGFQDKIANFQDFFCPGSIPKRDLDTKKTQSNIEVCTESLGAVLEYWYIECGLLITINALPLKIHLISSSWSSRGILCLSKSE